ncbi:serine hydrolase [Streptomyces sp. NPDC059396]|uniref:serine hydrolase n=1 Tax=Streptomyces sp. NPDC059396 TaxID=3346819 RepID=UPI00369927DA
MRHEGDTVAGESPGKSEQRNPSGSGETGDTTPGERDPRLAVFRDPPQARPSSPVATANRTPADRTLTLTPDRPVTAPVSPDGGTTGTRASGSEPPADEARAGASESGDSAMGAGAARGGEAARGGTAPAAAEPDGSGRAGLARTDGQELGNSATGAARTGTPSRSDEQGTRGETARADGTQADGAEPDGSGRAGDGAAQGTAVSVADRESDGSSRTGSEGSARQGGTGVARAGVPSRGDEAGRDVPAAGKPAPTDTARGGETAEGGSAATAAARPGEADAGSVDGSVRDGSGRVGEEGRGSASADAVRGDGSGTGTTARAGASSPSGEEGRAEAPAQGGAESGDAVRGGESVSSGAARKPGPESGDSGRGGAPVGDSRGGEAARDGARQGSADGPARSDGNAPGSSASAGTAQQGEREGEGAQGRAADGPAEGSAPAPAKDAPADTRQGPTWARDGIDQPTAVLTTRPPRIDQPTTSLKLPREPASTFVPLRPDPSQPDSSQPDAERTRQQPMPPLPPLDLLAELTNTPPPPETPVRTVVRRVKIWTPLVLLLLIVFGVVQSLRPLPAPRLALSADPTYTFEGGELDLPWPNEGQGGVVVEGVGTVGMYGKQKPAPIASVAKTMTAYVILKDHPISGDQVGPQITVDKQAGEESNRPDESTAPIEEGEQFTLKQMLQLLMIPSGNNAARLLARWDSTTEEAFVKKMNAAAEELGMTDTTYTDPSGLQATTVSTAADQIELGKAVMQNEVFREIVNTPQIKIPGVEPMIYNNNRILLEPGVSGIKTGSSTPAGGNLLWSANTVVDGKNRRIIGAVMGAQQGTTLDDKLQLSIDNSLKVIKAAQEGVTSAGVVKKGEVVGYVDDGLGGRTPVVATKELRAVGWAGLDVKLNLGAGAGRELPHTAEAGTVVGELTIGTGAGKVSTPVALQRALAEPGFGARLTRVG